MITSRAEGASALIALHHCRILRVIGAIHHFVITIITSGMGVPPIPSRASCACHVLSGMGVPAHDFHAQAALPRAHFRLGEPFVFGWFSCFGALLFCFSGLFCSAGG